jgi:glutamate synthase (ferredoxin)
LISRHYQYTQSAVAERLLGNWEEKIGRIVKVMPVEYKKALLRLAKEKSAA